MPILIKLNEDHSAISRFYDTLHQPILVQYPPELADLSWNHEFHRKLQDAIDRQRQATRRVHWPEYGWLRLTQHGNDGRWLLEKEG